MKQPSTVLPSTSIVNAAPKLSGRGLSILLALMCTIPIVVIAILFTLLPPGPAKVLPADVRLEGCPAPDFYELPIAERTSPKGSILILKNDSESDWTHVYLRVNRLFSAEEHEKPVLAGEEKVFELGRFQTRTGAPMDLTYNPVRNVEVYARLPSGARAVFVKEFPEYK